MIQKYRLP
ncbi:hypothetical protein D030_0762A, partial [Vibrio parahaemolyticus AQ3810]